MLSVLNQRQIGLISDVKLKQKQSNLRFRKLIPDLLHQSFITSVDLELSCNRYLLSSTSDGGLYLDDIVTNSSLKHETDPIFKSSESIETVQYMWDFETFTTSGWDRTLRIFDIENLQIIGSHEFQYKIAKHDVNATKQLCSVTGKKSCYLFDLKRQIIVDVIKPDVHLTNLQWNKENCNLLLIASEKGLFLWDIRRLNKYLVKFEHPDPYEHSKELFVGCTFSKEYSDVISFGSNGICLWNLRGGLKAELNHSCYDGHFSRAIQMCLPFYPCKPELVFVPHKNNVLVVTIPNLRPFHCYKDSFKSLNWIYNIPNSYNIMTGSAGSETIIWTPKVKAKKYI